MKNVILLALVSLASVNAFAAPKSAKIVQFAVDREAFGMTEFGSGYLEIEPTRREATLFLQPERVCPPGRFCTMEMRAPIIVKLPIVSKKTDGCQTVVYVAQIDRRMVDGGLQKLTITDNSNYSCMTQRKLAPVEATYETAKSSFGANPLHTYSSFIAAPFVNAQN